MLLLINRVLSNTIVTKIVFNVVKELIIMQNVSKLSDFIDLQGESEALLCSKNELWHQNDLLNSINNSRFRFMIDCHATGGSLFTDSQLVSMIEQIKIAKPHIKKLYMCDLMKEYHGYCNYDGQYFPFVWFADNNHVNKNLPKDVIYSRQEAIIKAMSKADNLKIVNNYSKECQKISEVQNIIQLDKPDIISEEVLMQIVSKIVNLELIYKPLPLIDHLQPDVESIIKLACLLDKDFNDDDSVIHFHCHGGKGRTTSMGLIFDMMTKVRDNELHKHSFPSLVENMTFNGYNLADTHKDNALTRYNFLESLYSQLLQIESYHLHHKISLGLEILLLRNNHQLNGEIFEHLLQDNDRTNDESIALQQLYNDIV
jgi:hypothetical protein